MNRSRTPSLLKSATWAPLPNDTPGYSRLSIKRSFDLTSLPLSVPNQKPTLASCPVHALPPHRSPVVLAFFPQSFVEYVMPPI